LGDRESAAAREPPTRPVREELHPAVSWTSVRVRLANGGINAAENRIDFFDQMKSNPFAHYEFLA
jgi:hypothetical protein